MSIEKAKNYLKKYDLDTAIMEFKESTATVTEAANVLKVNPSCIAKTLSFMVMDDPVLIVTAGDQKISNSKFKNVFKTKAKMIESNEVEKKIGHDIGGVCPFGVAENVKIYLDISLQQHPIIYPACGNSKSAIKLSPQQLKEILPKTIWIDVCVSKV